MKIGVICAMAEEIKTLLPLLKEATTYTVAGNVFHKGQLYQHEVTLVQSGIGKVQAAMTATALLDRGQVDLLINTGSAGGIGEGLHVGDVVISNQVAYHDAQATVFGYLPGQLPKQPQRFEASQTYVDKITAAATALNLTPKVGLIVTGDQFVSSREQIADILAIYPEALSCEMEGAAIGQVAVQFNKPFVVIRAMSDVADEEAGVSFDDFILEAGKKSAEMLLVFLKALV